jgi:ketosteroid isomerase-like protein
VVPFDGYCGPGDTSKHDREAPTMASDNRTDCDIADLTELWDVAAQAYLDGDLPRYAALANHAPDFTLTPPYGGDPRHGFDGSDEAVERTANMFRGGDVEVEVHASYASAGLAVLVAVERQHGTVGDLPRQEWSLRITLVFRRDGDRWQLVHRHADPLTRPVTDELFAEIARGEHAAPPR